MFLFSRAVFVLRVHVLAAGGLEGRPLRRGQGCPAWDRAGSGCFLKGRSAGGGWAPQQWWWHLWEMCLRKSKTPGSGGEELCEKPSCKRPGSVKEDECGESWIPEVKLGGNITAAFLNVAACNWSCNVTSAMFCKKDRSNTTYDVPVWQIWTQATVTVRITPKSAIFWCCDSFLPLSKVSSLFHDTCTVIVWTEEFLTF